MSAPKISRDTWELLGYAALLGLVLTIFVGLWTGVF